MVSLKVILKILIGLICLFVVLIVVFLKSESYQIVSVNKGTNVIEVEIKKVFGRKISESAINSAGLYHGTSKSWSFFNNRLRNEGQFNNGYWHGKWKDYNVEGHLILIREWNMGKLINVFIPNAGTLYELPKSEWPDYVNVKQVRPQQAQK